jgi:hypothetical protein
MYIPIVVNPITAGAGILAAVNDEPIWENTFLTLSGIQAIIALGGFYFHQRRLLNAEGHGWRMYVFHAWYGPPALAPLQYLAFSGLGFLAALPEHSLSPLLLKIPLSRLLPSFVAVNIPPLWTEIAYLHWRGAFQNLFQWIPVITLPIVWTVSAGAAIKPSNSTRLAQQVVGIWLIILGTVGTFFHLIGLGRQYRGYNRKALLFNWLSGPPVLAPFQIIMLGLLELIGDSGRRDK